MRLNNPLTPEQLKQGDLVEAGIYPFEILDAADTYSKAGNDMIKLKIRIYLPSGKERVIFDYLHEDMEFKVGHFAEATGLIDQYREGVITAESCIGKTGELKLIIKVSKDPAYGDKNSVQDYRVIPSGQKIPEPSPIIAPAPDDFKDSDLPF